MRSNRNRWLRFEWSSPGIDDWEMRSNRNAQLYHKQLLEGIDDWEMRSNRNRARMLLAH